MNLLGIGASKGIAIAKAFKLVQPTFTVPRDSIEDLENEKNLLEEALQKTTNDIDIIYQKAVLNLGEEHALIFDAHKQIANDPEIQAQVVSLINDGHNAAYAYDTVTNQFIDIFLSMDSEYMQERAADIKDVKTRVLCHLLNVKLNDPSLIDEEVIVVAEDLTPSDTAQLDKNFVKGFVTNIGGRTSHSAIMARSLEIPAIVGTKTITIDTSESDIIILDGETGEVFINPSNDLIEKYKVKQQEENNKKELLKQYVDKSTVTIDGHHKEIAANIGSVEDLEGVIKNGAEGIGLFRTEFLYMNAKALPTENEQAKAYEEVLSALKGKKVIIRTLDIGGDKKLDYYELPDELNPFLGHRALRLCLNDTAIFKTQLRALLKANKYGNLHIMFPMVATLIEVRKAKEILQECEKELISEGITIQEYKVGIMVEIPATAILADQFAKEVDFFSIGTNDLIQYTFAADRMNELVSYLYQPLNPSLLRLIKMVIDASHKEGKWTGMCGEMAGDIMAAPVLLGLGLDEFSMSASSVLETRQLLNNLSFLDMQKVANHVLDLSTEQDVKAYLEKVLKGE